MIKCMEKLVYFPSILHKIAGTAWLMMHIITKACIFGSTYKKISEVIFFFFWKIGVKDGYHGNMAKQAFHKIAMKYMFEST